MFRTRLLVWNLLLQMQWDGTAITGAINPGPNALPLTKASLDPETWQVHLEASGIFHVTVHGFE